MTPILRIAHLGRLHALLQLTANLALLILGEAIHGLLEGLSEFSNLLTSLIAKPLCESFEFLRSLFVFSFAEQLLHMLREIVARKRIEQSFHFGRSHLRLLCSAKDLVEPCELFKRASLRVRLRQASFPESFGA